MKRLIALLLGCALFLSLTPAALADITGLYFASRQVTYRAGEAAVLTVRAHQAPGSDLPFAFTDQRGNRYDAVLPAGKTEVKLSVADLPQDGSRTVFTLDSGESYVRRAPGSCQATLRGQTLYSFSENVYQTYVGREWKLRLSVENPGSLPAGTAITLRDQNGETVEAFEHQPNRTGYSFSFDADEGWVPGKTLSVWVAGRDTADDSTLAAVGYTGRKIIWGVERDDNKIAFTMDCGSHNRYVPRILEILDAYGVHITFFVTGKFAAANPDLVREMAARGHEIGNHSWNHPDFDTLKKDEIYTELTRTNDLLESITGQPVTVFRPPYGHCSGMTRSVVTALGMTPVRWTHESMDARNEASEQNSLRYSTKDLTGGSIILTHTSAACTVAVLEQILQYYQDNGFQVVPVSQLLLEDGAVDESGIQRPVQ